MEQEAPSQEAPQQPAPTPAREYPVQFTGKAGEYFRIWIVNLALTILTLGIYSAWAKVRRKRYFYSNTLIDGDNFEYRGRPLAILKGRVIAVAVTAAVYAATHTSWKLVMVVLAVAVFVIPWLLVRSYAFNAHNSVFRGVRFRFDGRYWKAWRLFVGYGFLTVITAGLGYFYLKTRFTEFVVRSSRYGTTGFAVPNLKPAFFNIYGKMIGLGIVASIVTVALAYAAVSAMGKPDPDSPVLLAVNAVSYVMYLGIFAFVRARILNATFNQATLGSLRFHSTLRARGLFKLYLVNIIAIVVTLGLAAPWAVIRTLRYRAEHVSLLNEGTLDEFQAAESAEVAATGEEVGEMLDIDFSL